MIEQLRAELVVDPTKLGFPEMVRNGDHAGIVKRINLVEDTRVVLVPNTFTTSRTLVSKMGAMGGVVMSKLRGFAAMPTFTQPEAFAVQATIREILPYISAGDPARGDGVDLGSPATQELFGGLIQLSVLTQAEVDAILDLARFPVSRAFELFGRDVTLNEVSEALNG